MTTAPAVALEWVRETSRLSTFFSEAELAATPDNLIDGAPLGSRAISKSCQDNPSLPAIPRALIAASLAANRAANEEVESGRERQYPISEAVKTRCTYGSPPRDRDLAKSLMSCRSTPIPTIKEALSVGRTEQRSSSDPTLAGFRPDDNRQPDSPTTGSHSTPKPRHFVGQTFPEFDVAWFPEELACKATIPRVISLRKYPTLKTCGWPDS
jgi:hypothetical protein